MSSTDVLLSIASAAQLFHASGGTGFADLIIDGHRETWPLRSKRFQVWLRQHYYERSWDAPSPAALNAALNVLEAQAQFDGPQRQVSVRLAEHDGLIYLDLADEFWRCVEIGPDGWRIAEDPPSGLPPWLSDTLCRLTSGGAFSTRRLFTDQDEMLFAAARPIILNGIEDIITRPDLADRAILLLLAPIAERRRRPEHMLWREFELARPYILGALLDAAAHGLRMLPQVRLKRLPRMADFALWATACESAFGPAGTFQATYSNNRRDAIATIVDDDPVAAHVRELMADRAQWTGSASDLLQVGINVGGNAMAAWTRSGWPKSPRALAGRLRRAQTFLRTIGIEIAFGREGRLGMRTIRITATGENRFHDIVSTVSRVSGNGDRAGLNHPRPGLEQGGL